MMISSSGNQRATKRMSSRANSGRVRWSGSGWAFALIRPRDDFPLPFFPLVSPWRLMYNRPAIGKAKTLVGAHQGWMMMRQSTTQSCPQLTRALDRLEIRGS